MIQNASVTSGTLLNTSCFGVSYMCRPHFLEVVMVRDWLFCDLRVPACRIEDARLTIAIEELSLDGSPLRFHPLEAFNRDLVIEGLAQTANCVNGTVMDDDGNEWKRLQVAYFLRVPHQVTRCLTATGRTHTTTLTRSLSASTWLSAGRCRGGPARLGHH